MINKVTTILSREEALKEINRLSKIKSDDINYGGTETTMYKETCAKLEQLYRIVNKEVTS